MLLSTTEQYHCCVRATPVIANEFAHLGHSSSISRPSIGYIVHFIQLQFKFVHATGLLADLLFDREHSRRPQRTKIDAQLYASTSLFALLRSSSLQPPSISRSRCPPPRCWSVWKLEYNIGKILQILRHLPKNCWIFTKIADFSNRVFC